MITINEYRNILAYIEGNLPFECLTNKEKKYAKKRIKQFNELTKQIEQLRKFFQIQNKYEEKKGE